MMGKFIEKYDSVSKSKLRVIVSIYLLTWLIQNIYAAYDDSLIIADEPVSYSWEFFIIASVVYVILFWVSSISAFFIMKGARWLFLTMILFGFVYEYIFGGGISGGSALNSVIGLFHTMLSGIILYVLFVNYPNKNTEIYMKQDRHVLPPN